MKYTFRILIAVILLFPVVASAATISVISTPNKVSPGEEFMVTVRLDTGDATVNAVSGVIEIDPRITVRQVLDGMSTVAIWVDKPIAPDSATAGKEIPFAGIIPGGLYGPGELFRFIGVASSTGKMTVAISDVRVLEQGQEPAPVDTKIISLKLDVAGPAHYSAVVVDDTIAPNYINLSIENDQNIFGGAPFAVFSATDKQSGIDRYEAAFSFALFPDDSSWKAVQSPYLIPKEGKGKLIWIRAIDRAGNHISIHIPGPNYYRNITILAILIAIFLCSVYFARKRVSS